MDTQVCTSLAYYVFFKVFVFEVLMYLTIPETMPSFIPQALNHIIESRPHPSLYPKPYPNLLYTLNRMQILAMRYEK